MAYLNGEKILFSPQVHIATPEVVQTTGDSETAVMSQKAVTEAISNQGTVDQTYNPISENAQSGNAVREAINSRIDIQFDGNSGNAQSGLAVLEGIYGHIDTQYSPTSGNAQSGVAVAEAMASIGRDYVLIGDSTLTQDSPIFKFSSDLNGNPINQYKDFLLYFYGSTTLGTSNQAFAIRANVGEVYFVWRQIGTIAAGGVFGFWHSIEEICNSDGMSIWKSNYSGTALRNVMENGISQGLSDNNVAVNSDFCCQFSKVNINNIDFFLPGTSGNNFTAGSRCMFFGRKR